MVAGTHTSNEQPQYSPQDARSDLPRGEQKLALGNRTLTGSPEARKSKQRQSTHIKKQVANHESPEGTESVAQLAKATGGADGGGLLPLDAEVVTAESNTHAKGLAHTITESSEAFTAAEPNHKVSFNPPTNTLRTVDNRTNEVRDVTVQHGQQEEKPKVEHASEKLQTQPSREPSPDERKALNVNMHSKPIENVCSRDQSRTDSTPSEDGCSVETAIFSSAKDTEEATLDVEARHDHGFRFARESQTDPGNVDPQPEPQDEIVSVDESSRPTMYPPGDLPAPGNMVLQPTSTKELPKENLQPHLNSLGEDATIVSKEAAKIKHTADDMAVASQNTPGLTTEAVPAAPTQSHRALTGPTVSPVTTFQTVPAVETLKKPGAQKVESLSPFAKPSKAQQKKDRELKRKQQKKAEVERAEKVKLDKTAPSGKKPTAVSNPITKLDVPAKSTTMRQDAPDQTISAAEMSKCNVKTVLLSALDKDKNVDGEHEDSGKRNGGKFTHTSQETGSVTHKMKVSQITKTEPEEKSHVPTGAPNAQSVDDTCGETTDCAHSHSHPVVNSRGPLTSLAQGKLVPAVPNPNFHILELSKHSADTQLNPSGALATLPSPTGIPTAPDSRECNQIHVAPPSFAYPTTQICAIQRTNLMLPRLQAL